MRLLFVTLVLMLAALQGKLWLSDDGYREVWRLRAEVDRQIEDNRRLQMRNGILEAEVRDLKDGLAAAEERARTDLGMIGERETFFQVVPAQGSSSTDRRNP